MTDHERLKIAFLEGKTLEEIGKQQGITRERARQILNRILSKETYLKQLNYNRARRPHITQAYKRICPSCNQEFSGREYKDKPFLICPSCRSAERQLRNLEPYICLNCGKRGVYKKRKGRERHFCSRKCNLQFASKITR